MESTSPELRGGSGGSSPPELAQPRPDPPRPGPGVADILIVDDEPELVRALRINLRARRSHVLTAGTARAARAVAAGHPPGPPIPPPGLPRHPPHALPLSP